MKQHVSGTTGVEITADVLQRERPDLVAEILGKRIADLEAENQRLTVQVAELERKLKLEEARNRVRELGPAKPKPWKPTVDVQAARNRTGI